MSKATYDTTTRAVTLELRNAFPVKTLAGETAYARFTEMSPTLLREILEQGALRILNDGIGSKDMSDTEKLAKINKRLDAWMTGNFRIVERADSLQSLMKECYMIEQRAKHDGVSDKRIEAAMRDTVKAALGDVNATFDNFMRAVASNMAKAKGESRTADELYDAIAAKYEKAANDLAAERSKAASKTADIDLSVIDLPA